MVWENKSSSVARPKARCSLMLLANVRVRVDNSVVAARLLWYYKPRQKRSNSIASLIDARLFSTASRRVDRLVIINWAKQ
jgi:hypothetical protein